MRRFHLIITMALMSLLAGCAGADRRAETAHVAVIESPVARGAAVVADIRPREHELQTLRDLAPDADPGVLALALEARSCAVRNGEVDANARLAIIDYSQPSSEKRLWVFDLAQDRLMHREYVAHGSGSGENLARHFSNIDGSFQTSLGLYRTAETYVGKNGYSLRMDGLDPGFNDNARQRAIVMHGAWYANPDLIRSQGRLGRSQGCPALREQIAKVVIDELKQRNLVFAYADDAAWLRNGRSFACDGRSAAQILALGREARGGDHRVASRHAS
jgi:hypothetical protein